MRDHFTPLDRTLCTRPLAIAHRGASAYAPENSLTAFTQAASMGADMVEVDLRFTSDGVPIITHDASLRRVYGIEAVVGDLTLEQLRTILPEGRDPIPTLEQVASVCVDLKLGLYLDIKELNRRQARHVSEILISSWLAEYTVCGSFRPDFVAELKAAQPKLCTSMLFGSNNLDPVLLAQSIRADYVHPCWESAVPEPHALLTTDWITRVRTANLGIICWHEERPAEITAMCLLVVDGICSDTLDVLAKLIGAV